MIEVQAARIIVFQSNEKIVTMQQALAISCTKTSSFESRYKLSRVDGHTESFFCLTESYRRTFRNE